MTTFIPRKIRVGYQERANTYTGKLAYVTYYDATNRIRKISSWEAWRNKSIAPTDLDNIPISGFVLNKNTGGYNYSYYEYRNAYIRVFDPRGFEFEITVSNLMYILENSNCIKGKGLDGEFIYGWDGTNLKLIPTNAVDYPDMVTYSNSIIDIKQLKGKDLIVGATYIDNKNVKRIYLGRFPRYAKSRWEFRGKTEGELCGNHYFFYTIIGNTGTLGRITTMSSLTRRIISCFSEDTVDNFAEIMDKLESNTIYSPVAENRYVPIPPEEAISYVSNTLLHEYYSQNNIYTRNKGEYKRISIRKETENNKYRIFPRQEQNILYDSIPALYNENILYKLERYLANGKLYTGQ